MQKLNNYSSNLSVLSKASEQDLDNEFIISGIIDKFSIQFELGWKLFKEILRYEGLSIAASGSPRDIIKGMYQINNAVDEKVWLRMLRDRNNMAHVYDGDKAKLLVQTILNEYLPEFQSIENYIKKRYGELE